MGESYLQAGLQEKAVEHLVILAESGEAVQWLRAAMIYEHVLKKQDKALYCYEQYLSLYPDSEYIREKISSLQEDIAKELMVLVETLGAERVWHDLDNIIDSPRTIYLNMLQLAKKEGNKNLSLEILKVIETNSNRVEKSDLAMIYDELGEAQKSYNLLKQTAINDQDLEFYRKKIELERKLNLPFAEYKTRFERYLNFKQTNKEISSLIKKTVEFGIPDNLNKMLKKKNVRKIVFSNEVLLRKVTECYAHAGEFTSAFQLLSQAQDTGNLEVDKIRLLQANLLQKRNFTFEAEQILRKMLINKDVTETVALLSLVQLEINNHNIKSARNWYEQFIEKRDRYPLNSLDKQLLKIILA